MSSTMVSRDGTARPGSVMRGGSSVNGSMRGGGRGPGRSGKSVSCNRCRRPLKNTIFVCSCDCVFCDECTFSHFNSSSNCPVCNKVLGETDLEEMMVMDPIKKEAKKSIQFLFTKSSPTNESLSFQEMCSRLMKTQEESKQSTKFLLKQLLLESSQMNQRMSKMMRANVAMKEEISHLKRTLNTQKVRYEEACSDMKQQLSVAQQKLEEKDMQLLKFRQIHERMVPSASRSGNSASGGSRNNEIRHERPPQEIPQPQRVAEPPLRGFMKQKMANERARQQELEQPRRQLIIRPGGGGESIGSREGHGIPHSSGVSHQGSASGGGGGGGGNVYTSGSVGSGGPVNKRRRHTSPLSRFSSRAMYSSSSSPRNSSPAAAFLQNRQNGGGSARPPPTGFFHQQTRYNT